MVRWYVESYTVNVGLGDGAIYLLLDADHVPPLIESAVLIDGGTEKGAIHLQHQIDKIKARHFSNDEELAFTSIVITHWDGDHYLGVEATIRANIVDRPFNQHACKIMHPYQANPQPGAPKTTIYFPKTGIVSMDDFKFTQNSKMTYRGTSELCHVCKGVQSRGVDLFSGTTIGQAKDQQTLRGVISESGLQQDPRPRLLVVGSDLKLLDNADVPKRDGGTLANASSIMCVLFTPKLAWDENEYHLYTGGDAEDDQETVLVSFLDASRVNRIDVIKAGHHGSKFATTEAFFKYFPEYFIISAAEDYGHPSFSLLFFLLAYFEFRDPWFNRDRVFCTRFPYWMLKEAGDGTLIDTRDIDVTTVLDPDGKRLRDAIASITHRPGLIDDWFPGGEQMMKEAYELMDNNRGAWARYKAYKKLGLDPGTVVSKLGDSVLEKWKNLQNGSIKRMLQAWPYMGYPKAPTMNFPNVPAYYGEISVIKARFGYTTTCTVEGEQYDAAACPLHWKTTYMGNKVIPTESGILNAFDQMCQGMQGRDLLRQRDELKQELEKVKTALEANKAASPAHLAFFKMASSSRMAPNRTDPLFIASTKFLDGLVGGQRPNFEWLKEACGATAVSNSMPLSVTLSTRKLQKLNFTVASEALKRQFGATVLEDTDDNGYNSSLQGILLGLSDSSAVSMGLGELLALVQFDYGKPESTFRRWLSPVLDLITVEIESDSEVPTKNGLWIHPQFSNRVVVRLIAKLQQAEDNQLPTFCKTYLGAAELNNFYVIALSTATCFHGTDYKSQPVNGQYPSACSKMVQTKITFVAQVKFDLNAQVTMLVVSITNDSLTFVLQPSKGTTLATAVDWILERVSSEQKGLADTVKGRTTDLHKILESIESEVHLRQIQITIGPHGILAFGLDIEILFSLGAAQNQHVPLHGRVRWSQGSTRVLAEIWSERNKPCIGMSLNPYFDAHDLLSPDTEGLQDYISIPHLINRDNPVSLPAGIPNRIQTASIEFTTGTVKTLHMEAKVVCSISPTKDNLPPLMLQELMVVFSRNFATKEQKIYFRGVLSLEPPRYLDYPLNPVNASLSLLYDSSTAGGVWSLRAEASVISMSHLYTMLPTDGSNHAMISFMSSIRIASVVASYTYNLSGLPNKLVLKGTLEIGPVQLDLEYLHEKGVWNFEAHLAPTQELSGKKARLIDLLHEFLDAESLDSLPDFVQNFEIVLSTLDVDLVCFKASLTNQPDSPSYVIFVLTLTIDKLAFTFVQIQEQDGAFPGSAQKSKPKRLIRFSLSAFPKVPAPVVQELPKPFDGLDFLWVNVDLTVEEVTLVNDHAFQSKPPISYQENQKKTGGAVVALAAGNHFQVLLHEQNQPRCVLDYTFGTKEKQENPASSGDQSTTSDINDKAVTPNRSPVSERDQTGGQAKSAPMTRSANGLTVKNITLNLKERGILSIALDASVTLGPLAFNLIGFSVHLDLNSFKNLNPLELKATSSLSGMAVAFSRPPATLAGVFVHKDLDGGRSSYMGGLALGVGVWEFLAAGAYEEHKGWNTVFVFVKLNGPLISFGSAEINGIVGGFGCNSRIRLPSVTEVMDFPFVQINTAKKAPAQNVMQQFDQLLDDSPEGWFKAAKDTYWLAAGLGIRAFQMVDIQAVMVLDLSLSPKFGIFAEAVARMPNGVDEDNAFLSTELTIAATYDPALGILQVAGQLTPKSYILHKSCKLTGGFTMAFFFPASGHDGDWVFSIGGYHPGFRVPSHYPRAPPRLGISWIYDSEISITGEAYFAITPQACMGGGRLDTIYQSNRVHAYFSAYADFLMSYDPFQFQASVGVSVNISATIGWGLLSKDISMEVSANVDLHGPPLAGVAEVHVWCLDITIHFGPSKQMAQRLEWDAFHRLFNPAGTKNDGEHMVSITKGRLTTQQDPRIQGGVLTGTLNPTPKQEGPILVRAQQFELQFEVRFPIMSLGINGITRDATGEGKAQAVYSTPMQTPNNNQFKKSDLAVTIEHVNGDSRENVDVALEYIVKNVPGALWNPFDDSKSLLDQPNTQQHLMGIKLKALPAESSREDLPPINMEKLNCTSIGGQAYTFPEVEIPMPLSEHPIELEGGVSKADLQADILKQWQRLRTQYTGGGPNILF